MTALSVVACLALLAAAAAWVECRFWQQEAERQHEARVEVACDLLAATVRRRALEREIERLRGELEAASSGVSVREGVLRLPQLRAVMSFDERLN